MVDVERLVSLSLYMFRNSIMNVRKNLGISLFFLMAAFFVQIKYNYAQGKEMQNDQRFVGGECNYRLYPGHAKIVSIKKITGTENPEGVSFEIRFTFHSDRTINEVFARTESKTFLLLHGNSYPDDAFVRQHDIAVDHVYPCIMKVIIHGTCTPVLFEFPDMEKHR